MTTFTLRMDDSVKKDLDAFCDKMGMNLTTFFMMYVKKTLRDKKIPFELSLDNEKMTDASISFEKLREQAKKNDLQNMTLKDINKEITLTRQARR